jgi:putative membrane protein
MWQVLLSKHDKINIESLAMFGTRTRQWAQSLLLLLLGLYILDNLLSGRIYYYINERFGWLSWVTAAILIVLSIVGVIDLMRKSQTPSAEAHHDHEGHDHSEHQHAHDDHDHHGHQQGTAVSWPILGVLVVPLALGILIPARPLGTSAIGTSGISTTFSSAQGGSTQLSIAPTERNVLDWVRAFNTSKNVDEFVGQPADFVGFVYRDIRYKDKPLFMTARFTVSCCVADASAIGVIVNSDAADKLQPDSWVHVKGKFQVQDLDGQKTPVLIAESVEPTAQPVQPYLYP